MDQLPVYLAADLNFVFANAKSRFSPDMSHVFCHTMNPLNCRFGNKTKSNPMKLYSKICSLK